MASLLYIVIVIIKSDHVQEKIQGPKAQENCMESCVSVNEFFHLTKVCLFEIILVENHFFHRKKSVFVYLDNFFKIIRF